MPAVVLALLLGLFGPKAATEAEKNAATRQYVSCLVEAAKDMDDHVSDATSIARGIRGRCAVKFQHLKDVIGQGMSYRAQMLLSDGLDADSLDTAVSVVLKVRKDPSFTIAPQ